MLALPSTDTAVPRFLLEPAGDHGIGDDGTGGGEPERGERPVHDGELPEVLAQPRRGQRRGEEDRAARRHRAGAEAIDEGADPRHERAVEEQAERDDEREAAAIDAEIGHHRLQKGPDRVPHAGRDEHHQRKGRRDPPAIEDSRGRLTGRGHGRLFATRVVIVPSVFVRTSTRWPSPSWTSTLPLGDAPLPPISPHLAVRVRQGPVRLEDQRVGTGVARRLSSPFRPEAPGVTGARDPQLELAVGLDDEHRRAGQLAVFLQAPRVLSRQRAELDGCRSRGGRRRRGRAGGDHQQQEGDRSVTGSHRPHLPAAAGAPWARSAGSTRSASSLIVRSTLACSMPGHWTRKMKQFTSSASA